MLQCFCSQQLLGKSIKVFFSIILVSFLFITLSTAQSDSTVFTYQEYVNNILKYHPIAKQANLKIETAKAEQLAAKGNFDPVISSDFKQKRFDDKLYYRRFSNRLQVPTKLGIDVVAGYENTKGEYFNPENKTDQFGLWNVGIEANLLQGLLIDERRTALQQAKIYQSIAENQQKIMLNELLYNASLAYLDWQQYDAMNAVIIESINVAATYFNNTKAAYEGGEKTAIDTLEAFIVLQDRQVLLQKNEVVLTKARQNLENYLWFNDLPLVLQPATQPENYTQNFLPVRVVGDINTQLQNHPVILEKLSKQAYYEVEQRMKREKLKPKLKLKYNPLLATSDNSIAPTYSLSDYTWGIDFSMPLLFRSERAAVQKGQIKIQEIVYDVENKRNELQNKLEGSLQQQGILQQQMAIQRANVGRYGQLLEAENQKFLYGESSVFLLNKRQEKYFNGQLKLIELNIKLNTEFLNYAYYGNELGVN